MSLHGGPCRIVLVSPGAADAARSARAAFALGSVDFDAAYVAGEAERDAAERLLHAPVRFAVDARLGDSRAGIVALRELADAHQGDTILFALPANVVGALVAFVMEAGEANAHRFAATPPGLAIVEAGPDGRGALRALNGDAAATGASGDGSQTRVFLIRHGHAMSVERGGPVSSHSPVPLTAHGRDEAARVAAALQPAAVDAIYSSDLVRARETAAYCARALGRDVVVDESLRELSIGDFEGTTLDRVHEAHPAFVPWLEITFANRFPTSDFHHPADLRFPNGQSVLDKHESALAGFLRLLAAERGRTIALVSHGWVLQPLLCHITGTDPRSYFRFSLPTATLAAARVAADGRGVLDLFNGGVSLDALPKLTNLAPRSDPAREPPART